MEETELYDIAEVCRMLGTTSRTLRFYEEKGIIKSTTVGISSRRRYSKDQLDNIRNVMVLRVLGLSVKDIAELQTQKSDLREAVISKRAPIAAAIDSHIKEINLLNDALFALESGKNIFAEEWECQIESDPEQIKTTELCTNAILNGDIDVLYKYITPRLAQYMPKDVYTAVRKDTFAPLGDFSSVEKITVDKNQPNKMYANVKFSKLGLKITFVFYAGMIDGLWLGYYDASKR